jgi:8-oxo-dGTP pyrophosphatase MutT (NUDIX family)
VIEDIKSRLQRYTPREQNPGVYARAAVLVPLYLRNGALHVVFTKRTDKVENHKGEISFPGGAVDPTDADYTFTALRESDEEIGLQPRDVPIIGRLDDIITISSYHVTAYVGEIDPARSPYDWRLQPREVAEVLEVPITHLLDTVNLVEVPRQRNGELTIMEGFKYGDHIIWGATARMLRNFLDVAVVPPRSPSTASPSTVV